MKNKSDFYLSFKRNLNEIAIYKNDELINRMLFIQVISVMEKYLYDVFIHEISTDKTKLKRLANENKFKEQKLNVSFVLNHSISHWIINTMKQMIWHRLNDVKLLYKNILKVTFEVDVFIVNAINKRHHLVHRNGFDFDGNIVLVSNRDLNKLISTIDKFILKIDDVYIQKNSF